METWITPMTLVGQAIRLEPLGLEHAEALTAALAGTPLLYIATQPAEANLDAVSAYITRLQTNPTRCPFAIVWQATGQPIGVTTYMDIRPAHRGLEIGSTWISAAHQGTAVNPESKFLLLRHAFETLGAIRVQIETDARNEQSRRAIEKLGAIQEGVLRHHMIAPDGQVRDTIMYSITADDWPAVRDRLVARLGYTL